MTTLEDMETLRAMVNKTRKKQLEEIHNAYCFLGSVINGATFLTDDERDSLKRWGNVNFALLDQADDGGKGSV